LLPNEREKLHSENQFFDYNNAIPIPRPKPKPVLGYQPPSERINERDTRRSSKLSEILTDLDRLFEFEHPFKPTLQTTFSIDYNNSHLVQPKKRQKVQSTSHIPKLIDPHSKKIACLLQTFRVPKQAKVQFVLSIYGVLCLKDMSTSSSMKTRK
jgi:hypothetical protein